MLIDSLLRQAGSGAGVGGETDLLLASKGGNSFSTLGMQRLPNLLPARNRRSPLRRGEFGAAEVFVDLDQLGFQVADVSIENEGGNGLPA